MISYILNVITRGRGCLFSRVALLSVEILRYTFSRRLGGPLSQFGLFTEDINPLLLP